MVGLTRGVFGKPGYLHSTVKMSDEQDREIARRIDARLQKTGEKYISNNDHWDITMEVLRETKNNR